MAYRTATWLKNNWGERDPFDYNIDLIDSFGIGRFGLTGSIFYVDPVSGDDTANDGTSSDSAYATMQTAVDACTADNGDVIVRMQGSETPSAAITFDCAGITVVAQGYGHNWWNPEKFSTYPAAGYATGPMAIITAPCAIVGLEFVTRNVTSAYTDAMTTSGAAIAVAGNAGAYAGGFSLIKHCRFVDWWGNDWGIEFGAGAYNLVEDCWFEGFTAGILMRGTSLRNPDYNTLQRNRFVDCTSGIEHYVGGCTAHNFMYYDNKFTDVTDSFDSNALASDGSIWGNWYETATDGSTYDRTVIQLQAQGIQLAGNHYSE